MADNVVSILVSARDQAKPDMDALKERLQEIGRQVATARATVDDKAAAASLDKLNAQLLGLDKTTANPNISMQGAIRAEAQIHAVEASLDHLDKDNGGPGMKARAMGFVQAAESLTGLSDAMGVADPKASMFQKVMAGAGLATGLLEPVVAGVTVAVGGMASGLVAAGAGLGIFGEVAKGVWGDYTTNIQAAAKAQLGLANGDTGAKMAADNTALAAAFKGLHGNVLLMVMGAANAETAWHNFTTSAADGVASVLAPALSLVPRLLSLAGEFLPPVEDALRHIVSMVSTGLNSSGFQSFVGEMAKLSGPMINNIAVAIGHVVVGIGGILKAFMPMSIGLSVGLDQLTSKFQDWGTSLSSHTGFQSLMETFKTETPMAIGILKNLATILKNVADGMTGLATGSNSKTLLQVLEPLSGILAKLSSNPDLVRIALYLLAASDAGKKLHTTLMGIQGAFGVFKSGASALQNLSSGFRNSAAAASEATGVWGTMGGKLSTIGSALASAGAAAGRFAVTMTVTAAKAIADFVATAARAVASAAVTVASFLAEAAAATIAFIAENLATLGIIAGIALLVAAIIMLATHWKQVWGDVKNWALDAWHFIDNDVIHPIADGISKLASDVEKFFENMFSRVTSDTRNWASDVVNFFKSLPGKAISALSNLGSMMFNAGVHAIESLIDGIGSKIGDIGSVMGNVASKIAGFIGLSPAKEGPLSGGGAPEIRGSHITADIATGMLSGVSRVAAAGHQVASAAAIGSSSGGVGGGSSAGGGQVNLQIQAGGGSGMDQLFMTWLKNTVRVSGGDPRIFNRKVAFL